MSEELSSQANQLQTTMAFFKTDQRDRSAGVRQPAPSTTRRRTSTPAPAGRKSSPKRETGLALADEQHQPLSLRSGSGQSDDADLDGEFESF